MATVVSPNVILEAYLSALIASGGSLHLPTVILFVNDLTPGPTTVLADLTIATFDGYANIVGVTWSGPFLSGSGIAEIIGSGAYFAATGSTLSQIAYGYALVDSGVTSLKVAARFDTPKQFNGLGDALMVIPRVQVQNQAA